MTAVLKSFAQDESGATAIEYALIASLLSVAIIASLTTLKGKVTGTYTKVGAVM